MIPLVKTFIAPKEEMMPAIEKTLYSGYIAEGEDVYEFERKFSKFIGNKNVLALSSGTAALHIAFKLLDIKEGDEVISTAMTAEPTNTTIALVGAKVVWADVDLENGLLIPSSIESKITKNTKAIVLVHYAGMVCDMDEINKISEKYNIPIIEDAAHALGSKYNNQFIGKNSLITIFSFQAIKHMTTVDGGLIAFKDDRFMDRARKMRWFGLDKHVPRLENDIVEAGFKYGMNNVTAAIGNVQIEHLRNIIECHVSNGKFFDKELQNVKGVKLVKYNNNTEPSYWLYTLFVDRRDEFIDHMNKHGISASPLHHRNDTHSVFAESLTKLPNLDEFYSNFVHIPCGWWVSEEDRKYIVEVIKKGW